MGNKVNVEGENVTVEAFQEVDMEFLSKMSEIAGKPGADFAHELTEAYEGAKIAKRKKKDTPMGNSPVYQRAHQRALPQTAFPQQRFYDSSGNVMYPNGNGDVPYGSVRGEDYILDRNHKIVILGKYQVRNSMS